MNSVQIFLLLAIAATAVEYTAEYTAAVYQMPIDFQQYAAAFGKVYQDSDDLGARGLIFNKSLAQVQQHNAKYESGGETWWAIINEFR